MATPEERIRRRLEEEARRQERPSLADEAGRGLSRAADQAVEGARRVVGQGGDDQEAPGQEDPNLDRLRSRLEEAATGAPGPAGEPPTAFDRLRTRLEQASEPRATPTGDPEEAPIEQAPAPTEGGELPDFMSSVFHEERDRLGLGAEAARGLARVPGQITEGVGGVAQSSAAAQRASSRQMLEREREAAEESKSPRLRRLRLERAEETAARAERFQAGLRRAGEFVEELGRTSREFFPASRSVTEAEELDLTDPNVLVSGGAEAIGQIGAQLLLAAGTGGGSAVTQFLMFAGPTVALEGGNSYLETKDFFIEQGMDPEAAEERAAGVAASTAAGAVALERIPAARFLFNRVPGAERILGTRFAQALAGRGGRVTQILSGAAPEAAEEALQEAWAATIQDIQANNPEAWEDIGPRLAASATFGGIGGAFAGAVTGGGRRQAGPEPGPDPAAEPAPPPGPEAAPEPEAAVEGDPEAEAPPPAPPDVQGPAAQREEAAQPPEGEERRAGRVRRRIADLLDPERAQRLTEQERRIAEQQEEMFRDELTGVQNQKAWIQARDRVGGDPGQEIVWIDAINFKAVNKFETEAGGDRALQRIAAELGEIPGLEYRQVFRAGGDEFALVVPAGEGEAFGRLAEEKIGERTIGDTNIPFSVRFGVGAKWEEAAKAADIAKGQETGPRFRDVTEEGVVEGDQVEEAPVEEAVEAEEAPAPPPEPAEAPRPRGRKARLIPTRGEDGGVEIRTEEVVEEEVPAEPEGERFTTQEVPGSGGMVQVIDTRTDQPVTEPGMPVVVEPELEEIRRRAAREEAPAPEQGSEPGTDVALGGIPPAIRQEFIDAVRALPRTTDTAEDMIQVHMQLAARNYARAREEGQPPTEALRSVLHLFDPEYHEGLRSLLGDREASESLSARIRRAGDRGERDFDAGVPKSPVPDDVEHERAWILGWERAQRTAPRRAEERAQAAADVAPPAGTTEVGGPGTRSGPDLAALVHPQQQGDPQGMEHWTKVEDVDLPDGRQIALIQNTDFDNRPDEGLFNIVQTDPTTGEARLIGGVDGPVRDRIYVFTEEGEQLRLDHAIDRAMKDKEPFAIEAVQAFQAALPHLPRGHRRIVENLIPDQLPTAPMEREELKVTAARELFGISAEYAGMSDQELMTAIDDVFSTMSGASIPGNRGVVFVESGGYAHLRNRRNDQSIEFAVEGRDDFVVKGQELRDLVRSATQRTDLELEDMGQLRLPGLATNVQVAHGRDPELEREFTAAEVAAQREAEAEVSVIMGRENVATPERVAEIEALTEEETDAGQLEGAPQEELEAEPTPDLQGAVEAGEIEPAPPGGRPGGPRDVREDVRTDPEEEPGVDAGPGREGRERDRSSGDRTGERPGEPGSGSPGRLSGLNLRIRGELVDEVGSGGAITKTRRNLEAIRILKDIEAQGRQATRDEQEKLVLYAGWGGIPQVFNLEHKRFGEFARELQELLTPEEYRAARESTVNAHFTSTEVIQEMHRALEQLGLGEKSKVLEPAVGIGHFLGLTPGEYNWFGIELDSLTARMAKLLYPRHEIHQRGYEETPLPNNHFDAAVSNVPFGDFVVDDPAYRDRRFTIHNYYFDKSLDKVRPGGLVMFITSHFTLDAKDSKVRRHLAEKADFIGAVRMPKTTFRKSAGTDVVADIIVMRKRAEGEPPSELNQEWVDLAEVETEQGPTQINRYFVDNPDQVVGTHSLTGTMHGTESLDVLPPDGPLRQQIGAALGNLPTGVVTQRQGPVAASLDLAPIDDAASREGAYQVVDGEIMQVRDGRLQEGGVAKTQTPNVKALIGLRDTARRLIQLQLADATDAEVQEVQKELNTRYDRYVKKRGPINKEKVTKAGTVLRPNYTPFRSDPDAPLVSALEVFDSESGTAKKAAIFSERVVDPRREITEVDQPKDALPVVLAETGRVDIDMMAELAGVTPNEMVAELRGRIYLDPARRQWLTDDEYLSGNVREKLLVAREAAEEDPVFRDNVEALERVQPEDLPPSKIDVGLGAPWVPKHVYEEFINELLGREGFNKIELGHAESQATWTIEEGRRAHGVKATQEWGTKRYDAVRIFETVLNQKSPTVHDRIDDRSVKNVEETLKAREKAHLMKERFRDWIWRRPDADALAREYNERFNNTRVREFDGSHLKPVGISSGITPHAQQLDGAWRIISSGNTMLAHVVGAGKTFTMQMASMEEKRMGLVNKPVHVVPNHMLEQYTREFLQLYPSARLLAAEKRDFTKKKRQALLGRIATGDWDAIIMTHSAFGRIDVSRDTRRAFLEDQLDDIERQLREARGAQLGTRITKVLVKAQKRAQERLARLMKAEAKDPGVTFEELGIDRIFLDEAHLFKNLHFTTKMEGVSPSSSQRSTDMFMKIQYLEGLNPGRSAVFATATPIANSISEVYTMMRYLQLPLLEERGLQHFDAWAAQFGEVVTSAEIKPDGSGYRMKDRFAHFKNVPELSQMFRQVWDVKRAGDLNLPTPRIRGGTAKVVAAPASAELESFVQELAERAENIRNVDPSEDNMLKITTEGRKAALDMRLIDPTLERDPEGKVARAADEIYDIWLDTAEEKLTQLVFIDFSAPKPDGFHVYGELKEMLLERGIPENEVAFIHDANSDLQKAELFQKVREGRVRILFGSTAKMGVGTNVQTRLVALHHLDAPWRPADIEQRDGRGVRQGNLNDEIQLVRYVTEGSFDAYMWQGLERKQFFIEQVMTGDPSLRRVEDISGTALNASETKALASGNPLAIEKASVDADVARLQRMQRSHIDEQYKVRQALARLPQRIEATEERLEGAREDAKRRIPTAGDAFGMSIKGSEYSERTKAGERLKALAARYMGREATEPEVVGTIGGFDLELSPPRLGDHPDRPRLTLRGTLSYHVSSRDEVGALGLIRRLEARVDRIPKEQDRVERELKALRKELRDNEALADQPFARADELAKLEARKEEIDRELNITGPQQDEQVAQNDEGFEEDTYGEAGLTEAELKERDDSGFLDIRALMRRSTRDQLITSDFPEVEARYQKAKGIERPGIAQRAKKAFEDFVAAMRRVHPEIDPDESVTMALNTDILRQFAGARDWSLAMAYAEVRKVMDGLNEPQVDLVTRMLVLPDIQKDVEEGLYENRDELPFGYDEDSLEADLAKFRAAAAADDQVTEALRRRGEINRELTKRLVRAGLLPKEVMEDDRYYHRQVLKYFQARDFIQTGVGGRDVRLRRKGFQKGRVGGGDFNTAYQESEIEWMSQGFELLARMGTLERLQELNDIKPALKAEAKVHNHQAAMEAWREQQGLEEGMMSLTGDDDPFLVFRQRIAFSNAALAKLAVQGDIYSEGGRFDDLIDQLANGYADWKVDMADRDRSDRESFTFQHQDWFPFLSHLLDNDLPGAMQAATIFKAIQDREKLTRELAGPRYIDPKDAKALARRLAPEGYTDWQPDRGTHLFLGLTVEERVVNAVLSGERSLEREDVRQQLIVGGPKETWIIRSNLAQALDNVKPFPDAGAVDNLWRAGQQSWKQWILLNPLRALRYNLNNMSGDADIAFAYDPKIVKGGVQAAKDLAKYFRGNADPELEKEILEYTRLGVVGSTLRVAEIPDITDAGAFQFLTKGKLNPGRKVVNRYWTSVRGFTDWRENILRLSAARYFDERIRTGEEPIYAASRRTEIDAITDPRHKAAKLSRELIGDYGAISKGGIWLRRHMIPFWSWIEINAPRYYRLLANTRHEGQTRGRGRRASALAVKKGSMLVLKMNVLFLLANLWNHLFFPDEEEELQRGRRQLHLILGRREDGSIRSLRMEGALSDALEWFNLQDYPSDIADLISNRKTVLDQGAEFVKAPVERLINSWEPFTKTLFETALGRSTYPTVFEEGASFEPRTRPIRDRGEHVSRTFSLNLLYNRVTGKPRRPSHNLLDDFLGTVLLYSTDPGEAAYWQTRDMISDWMEDQGQMRADISPTRRSTALYYWKKAVQWGDDEAAVRWEREYRELGGTDRGMRQSLQLSAPLGPIARSREAAFYQSLNPREQDIVDRAEEWFYAIYGESIPASGSGRTNRRRVRTRR